MGKQKKIKYKDVVGKNKQKNFKTLKKKIIKTKVKSVKNKRRYMFQKKEDTIELANKTNFNFEEDLSSEDETFDTLNNLRETLGVNHDTNSDDSNESETEVELNGKDSNLNMDIGESNSDLSEFSGSDEETCLKNISLKKYNATVDLLPDGSEKKENNFKDPFVKHVMFEVHESILKSLQMIPQNIDSFTLEWNTLGRLIVQIPSTKNDENMDNHQFLLTEKKTFSPPGTVPSKYNLKILQPADIFIRPQLEENLYKANTSLGCTNKYFLTSLQNELFSVINNYQDLFYPYRNFNNAEEIRFIYCLHVLNHVLKTRTKIVHHNARLNKKEEIPDSFRDQGLVRPKVLIILPFKDAAYKVITKLIDLLLSVDKGNVVNRKRFEEEFTGNEIKFPKKNPKPEDYELLFAGNSSDDFKIGLSLTKKTLKLYANFYSSDIIVASPLALRTIIGAEGESERDFDFLASIELLILDQTEIFLMQNWDHLIHILNHMHLQPKESHGTDFSRVRTWSLNGWAKYYRQTLIFSSVVLPEINSVFNKKCLNYRGKVKILNPITLGIISQVAVQLPHIFYRFDVKDVTEAIDARFDFFLNKVLPQQKDALMKQTVIFLPNYFDYVHLRNYFKKEDISFKQVCEYSKAPKVARARDMFYHGDAHFLLYTERYHFYNRVRLKAIRHLIFYQLPNFPNFYAEICNLMQETNMNRKLGSMSNMTVTVIYSKYDANQLAAVVGTERAAKMISSDNNVHMMVTGSD